jgi:hypothetical protein
VIVNIVLWVAGALLLAIGIFRVRAPYARMSELDRLADNSRRYESWRGNRLTDGGTSGADVMRAMLRRQVIRWAAACVVGILLIVAGFAIR